jgi:hypothetical protein
MRTSVVGKILVALIFASVIGISAGPVFADNDHRGGPKQQGRHDNRRWHDDREYRSYRYAPGPYYSRGPYYAPPPVIYAPIPSPGISIFFPPIHIR